MNDQIEEFFLQSAMWLGFQNLETGRRWGPWYLCVPATLAKRMCSSSFFVGVLVILIFVWWAAVTFVGVTVEFGISFPEKGKKCACWNDWWLGGRNESEKLREWGGEMRVEGKNEWMGRWNESEKMREWEAKWEWRVTANTVTFYSPERAYLPIPEYWFLILIKQARFLVMVVPIHGTYVYMHAWS